MYIAAQRKHRDLSHPLLLPSIQAKALDGEHITASRISSGKWKRVVSDIGS
ncbi:unnamed protein product, partial [Ectocarpus sp. 13 AM-2016]